MISQSCSICLIISINSFQIIVVDSLDCTYPFYDPTGILERLGEAAIGSAIHMSSCTLSSQHLNDNSTLLIAFRYMTPKAK